MRQPRLLLALAIWSASSVFADAKDVPPGLQRVLAEGAGRVVNMTCADVRSVVAWIGEAKAEASARAAGASEAQIARGKRCLKSSSR